jgi:pyruvate formate lyase activating enzyme
VQTLEKAVAIGQREGLLYVYPGNVFGHPGESTRCPACGTLVITRIGYQANLNALTKDGHCARCGADVNIRTATYQRRLPVSAGP